MCRDESRWHWGLTEGSIENDLLALERRRDVTTPLEHSSRGTPTRGVWRATGDIGWNGTTGEEVYGNSIGIPQSSVDTTIVAVEPSTIAIGSALHDLTTRVCGLAGGVNIAIRGCNGARKAPGIGDRAARACVKGHSICGLLVNTFDDINFAAVTRN
jgi:hypothetical protein